MIAWLAGIVIVMLVASEIAVIVARPQARQIRTAWLGALTLVLLAFGAMWLVRVVELLTQTP